MNLLPSSPPILETHRLQLRPMQVSDIDALFAIYGDAKVMLYTSDPPFPEPGTVLEMLASIDRLLAEGTSIEWAIEVKNSHQLIGTCGLHSFEPSSASAEVGCVLGCDFWGNGYMQEALVALFEYAKQNMRLTLLKANIDAPNLRSIRLFEKLGFNYASNNIFEAIL